jgi:uncharacterized membrane protein YkvA (DUF1232 family)
MVAPDTDDTTNQEDNEPMPTEKTPKGNAAGRAADARDDESTTRAARKGRSGSRGGSRSEGRGEGTASRAFDFMRQRLNRDADSVSERDIHALRTSVPEKLEAIDTKALRKELEWVGEMVGRIRTLWDMLFDKDFVVDWKSKALVGAALLYFVMPADLTPDFIPGIGYIDDALVLATLWRLMQEKIDEYLNFKRANSGRRVSPKRASSSGAADSAEAAAAG